MEAIWSPSAAFTTAAYQLELYTINCEWLKGSSYLNSLSLAASQVKVHFSLTAELL